MDSSLDADTCPLHITCSIRLRRHSYLRGQVPGRIGAGGHVDPSEMRIVRYTARLVGRIRPVDADVVAVSACPFTRASAGQVYVISELVFTIQFITENSGRGEA